MASSRALIPQDAGTYGKLRDMFVERYPAPSIDDSGEWHVEAGGIMRLLTGGGRPIQVATGVMEVLGFFGTDSNGDPDGRMRLSFTTDADKVDKFFEWCIGTFAPDGTLHKAIVENFSALVGKTKPAGVTAKNVSEKVRADLESAPGVRPLWAPQVVKHKEDEDGKKSVTISFTVYLCDEAVAKREPGTLPDEVAAAFQGMEDHPIAQYLASNPNQAINSKLAFTVADGSATPVEILAAGSHKGKNGYYFKVFGSATIGGWHTRYNEARRLLMARMYLNTTPMGGGLRIFIIPNQTHSSETTALAEDVAVYDQVTGMKREADEDVYSEAIPNAKVARVDE